MEIYKPICSKCNCEIKNLDMTLTYDCNCNNKEEELNMMEKDHGCICSGCKCYDCCDCGYYDYYFLAKKVNENTSSFFCKIYNEKKSLRNYCRIEPRSIIGEHGILINKISSKITKWIYHIFNFTNTFKKNHISNLYDNIYFKECKLKTYHIINNNNFLFYKAKKIIETILNAFLLKNKNINIKERNSIFNSNISSYRGILNEENIKILEREVLDIINSIKSNDNKLVFLIKTFILDLICCLKILNRNPLFRKELKLLNLLNKIKNNDILFFFNKYFEIMKELEDNYNHKYIIEQMHIIKDKNLILLLTKYDIRIYDINDLNFNSCICFKKIQNEDDYRNNIKIVMISDEFFILRKAELLYRGGDTHLHHEYKNVELFLLELQYNSSYKDKKVELIIHNLKLIETIYDLDAINKNNIICIDNKYIYFYNLVKTDMNLISKISIIYNFYPYFIIADKLNQQILLLHSYKYNLLSYNINNECFYYKENILHEKQKSYFNIDFFHSERFKILNKDTYLSSINDDRIYLISSKYLELICEYDLKYKFDKYFILNNMNMIFFIYKSHIAIYKFEKGELHLYKKKKL